MIDQSEILKVCGQTLIGAGITRIVWPNADALPAKPYVVMELRPRDIQDRTLEQTAPVWSGTLAITVVTALDQFDTEAQTLVRTIAGLFPAASRLFISFDGYVAISGHPSQAGPGYRDGADWRTTVNIPLRSDG